MSECLHALLDELKIEATRTRAPADPIHGQLARLFERAFAGGVPHGFGALVRLTRQRADGVLAAAGISPSPWCTHTARLALGQCGRMAQELPPTSATDGERRAELLARARAVLHPLARLLHVACIRIPDAKAEHDVAVLANAVLLAAGVSLEDRGALLRDAFGLG
jgi:hypothetical protein